MMQIKGFIAKNGLDQKYLLEFATKLNYWKKIELDRLENGQMALVCSNGTKFPMLLSRRAFYTIYH